MSFLGIESLYYAFSCIICQKTVAKRSNVLTNTPSHHVLWKCGLQFAFPDEKDHRVKGLMWEAQKFRERHRVAVVLVERILEGVFFSVKALSPFRRSFITENPSIHVLGLDHEYAEDRNHNMIDLSSAALRRDNEIVKSRVVHRVEAQPHSELSATFPEPAFEDPKHGGNNTTKLVKSPE